MRSDAVAIVPAGGAARRLGPLAPAGKAALVAGGRSFLDLVCTALAAEVPRVIVVAPADCVLPTVAAPVEVIRDTRPGAGPLAAVCDGLAHAVAAARPPRLAVLCSCDVPLLSRGVIRLLLETAAVPPARWALPVIAGRPQPLPSALAVDLLPDIRACLAAGRGGFRDLAELLARTLPAAVVPVPPEALLPHDPGLDSFRDVDTPEDLAALAARRAPPTGG